jgi:RimJ/RimL family protein N-acetyltransferase
MPDALTALLDHAFGDLGLHRIEADVDPRNEASLRLLEKLGFRREGYLRERYLKDDEIQDTVLLGLLRGDPRP